MTPPFPALKGRTTTAQGNALGVASLDTQALKGRHNRIPNPHPWPLGSTPSKRASGFLPRRGLRLPCNPSGVDIPSTLIPGVRFATPLPLPTLRVENACSQVCAGPVADLEPVAAAPGVFGKPMTTPFPALKGRPTTARGNALGVASLDTRALKGRHNPADTRTRRLPGRFEPCP